jgi:pimeloyl-ACP methyl ester carboxylesterase
LKLAANGLQLEVDDRGPPGGAPLLLIMGLGMQLIAWPDELLRPLVAGGLRVVRLDNRDAGLSQGFDHLGVPVLPWAGIRWALHLPLRPPYTLADMAADALGVLDALGIAAAHVCGASMGGMIAQHIAAHHPQRVRSLALLMTTSGARHLPQPPMAVRSRLMHRPDGTDPAAVVAHLEALMRLIGSPGYRPTPEALRQRLQATVARAWRPAGTARQLLAVLADGDRTPLLGRITAPTVVIHGRDDPLVPFACGEQLAAAIPDARLHAIAGMGHDLPPALMPEVAGVLMENAARAG